MVGEGEAEGPVAAAAARCALHPERAAIATCTRCGNYRCELCSAGGSGLCLACRERQGPQSFPFNRANYSLTKLFDYCFERWKQRWLALMLVLGVALIVTYAFSVAAMLLIAGDPRRMARPMTDPSFLVQMVVYQTVVIVFQIAVQLPVLSVFLDATQNRNLGFESALATLRRLPAALLQLVLWLLLLSLTLAVFVAPLAIQLRLGGGTRPPSWLIASVALAAAIALIYLSVSTIFGVLELLYTPRSSALGALVTSFRIVDGHRLRALGILFVAGLVTLAGMLACGIGLLATGPFATLLYCALFLALRTEPAPA